MGIKALFLFLSIVFFTGCTIPGLGPTCNPPYILVGNECCLDQNNNSVCDTDEGAGSNISAQASVCNPPYFEYRTGDCCLDTDANQICDSDEAVPEGFAPEESDEPDPCAEVTCEAGEYCSEGACVASAVFGTIPSLQVQLVSWCGDGICSSTENASADCCADCGCPSGQYCSNNTCYTGTPPLFIQTDFRPIFVLNIQPPTIGEPIKISIPTGRYNAPRIYENKITYSRYTGGEYHVFLYDIYTKNETKMSDEYSVCPNIHDGKLVWTEYSRTSGEHDIADAYYYNYATGVEGAIAPRTISKSSPRIARYFVVWAELPNGYDKGGSIHSYHIPSGQEKVIFNLYKEDFHIGSPAIWEVYVVWGTSDCSVSEDCYNRLYLYDLSKESGGPILETDEDIWSYSIGGGKVAYVAGTSTRISENNWEYDVQVYVYDISTKLTKKITNIKSSKSYVSTDGETVVWADDRDGTDIEIFAYDLSENKEIQITQNSDWERYPDVYGNKIVYLSGPSVSLQSMYLYYLS